MKDLEVYTPAVFQEFYTARELAEIARDHGIGTFPSTKRGVQILADRFGWALDGRSCRRRTGRGGGFEYHFTLLPESMISALHGRALRSELTKKHELRQRDDRAKLAAMMMASLGAHPKAVMIARAEVLQSIDGFASSHGRRRSWGIKKFLAAQEQMEKRQEIEARRDRGNFLTVEEVASLAAPLLLSMQDGFDIAPEVLAQANDRASRPKISRTTIYDWFAAFDSDGVSALAPAPTKTADPIPDGFFEFMRFYARPAKPTIAEAHRDYLEAAEKHDGPQPITLSLDTVSRILRKRLNNIEKNVGREGILTLRSRMSYITRTTENMLPTTVYTADGKTFDAEVADPVSQRPMRPEITSVLDVATRKCVGYAVSRKENVIAVTEALRRSCSAHGICAIFYTDRGAGYKNKTFDADAGGLMGRLGITKMHALPYNSQAKGIIERFNHVWNDLARKMPTYMGRDMDKQAKQSVHRETRSEIVAFGSARRLPSWEDFTAAVEASIEKYNDRPHSGLPRFVDPETGKKRHMTPNEAWDMHVAKGFEAVRIDPEEEDDLFRPYVKRNVHRCLINLWTNEYFSHDLDPYHEQEVYVGYDYNQADRVWVREIDADTREAGKLICVAEFMGNAQRYIPLTVERKAIEDRNRNAIKRLDRRRRDKEAELGNGVFLEHDPSSEPIEIILPAEKPELVAVPVAPARLSRAARTQMNPDAELAMQCLEDPSQLTPGRARLLRDVMASRAGQEVLRNSGVDLQSLDDLLRSAA